MNTDDDRYLSTRAAAQLLGVSLRTVQLWVENGTLVAWKTAGGHRRIYEQSVSHIINQRKELIAREHKSKSKTKTKELVMLVVEDDIEVRDAYCLSISMTGLPITIITAANGFEGLIKVGKHHPDIVMTDLMMPNMDGYEMINAIKADKEQNPGNVIVVTAIPANNSRLQSLAETGVVLFHKPLDINKLEELLINQVNGKQYA